MFTTKSRRVHTITVTSQCNQDCEFCDRVIADRQDPSLDDLLPNLDRAVATGMDCAFIVGGEATSRSDLTDIVAHAKKAGFAHTILLTNASEWNAEAAHALVDAGLDEVQVLVPTFSPDAHAELVSAETQPADVERGIAGWLGCGVDLSICLPLAAGLHTAAERMDQCRQRFPNIDSFRLWPALRGGRAMKVGHILARSELGAQVVAAADKATADGLRLAWCEHTPTPPCVVDGSERAAGLFPALFDREPEDGPNAAPQCADCALASRCSVRAEQLTGWFGAWAPKAIEVSDPFLPPHRIAFDRQGDGRVVLGDKDAEQFFHVNYEWDAGPDRESSRVGVIYRCNQPCTFCHLARMSTQVPPEKVHKAIVESRERGSARIIFTGGEPTLCKTLVDYVAAASALEFTFIEIQSNAVLLAQNKRVEELVAAGLHGVQVSLHGPDSAISDALTAAPGTHQKTLLGIDNVLAAGLALTLNHLIFTDNRHLLTEFIELIKTRWSESLNLITVQFRAPKNEFQTDEEAIAHIAKYSDYVDDLKRAIDAAREAGIYVDGMQDPTGIPSLCILDGHERYLGPLRKLDELERFHQWEQDWFTRVPACESCGLADYCGGVSKEYLALHGDDEFHAVDAPVKDDSPQSRGAAQARGRGDNDDDGVAGATDDGKDQRGFGPERVGHDDFAEVNSREDLMEELSFHLDLMPHLKVPVAFESEACLAEAEAGQAHLTEALGDARYLALVASSDGSPPGPALGWSDSEGPFAKTAGAVHFQRLLEVVKKLINPTVTREIHLVMIPPESHIVVGRVQSRAIHCLFPIGPGSSLSATMHCEPSGRERPTAQSFELDEGTVHLVLPEGFYKLTNSGQAPSFVVASQGPADSHLDQLVAAAREQNGLASVSALAERIAAVHPADLLSDACRQRLSQVEGHPAGPETR